MTMTIRSNTRPGAPRTEPARLLSMHEASDYCRLPYAFFKSQVKHRCGPNFTEVGPRSKFFEAADLDKWMQSWYVHQPVRTTGR